jgi:hypothetical protein
MLDEVSNDADIHIWQEDGVKSWVDEAGNTSADSCDLKI